MLQPARGSPRRRRRTAASVLVGVCFAVIPASPAAAATCMVVGDDATITNNTGFGFTISNDGGVLEASGVSCGPISALNHVDIQMDGSGSLIFEVVGGLGPGVPDEGNATSELEFSVFGVDSDVHIAVTGTPAADGFAVGDARIALEFVRQINLNALAEAGGAKDSDVAIHGVPNKINLGGNAGNDVLTGTGGFGLAQTTFVPLSLHDGADSDTLIGGNGDDQLDVQLGSGTDSARGGLGTDQAFLQALASDSTSVSLDDVANDGRDCPGSSCEDDIGSDVEFVVGSNGSDHISGTAAGETIWGGIGSDQLLGGGGNDTLYGDDGNDLVNGGGGNDHLRDGEQSDILLGGQATDTADFSVSNDAVTVTLDGLANDGSAGFDNIGSDIERILGSSQADRLVGRAGTQRLIGGGGGDILDGRDGNDTLSGEEGNDRLFGGPGADSMAGQGGADAFRGGTGQDTATYATSLARVFVSLDGSANDGSSGEGDNVRMDVERVIGSNFADRLLGSGAANILRGRSGADVLRGFGGNDLLFGEAGNDTFNGGTGSDLCAQGTGRGRKVSCER